MNTYYKINKELLKKGRDINRCLCKVEKTKCPCDDFLNNDKCICGVYEKIEAEE